MKVADMIGKLISVIRDNWNFERGLKFVATEL